MLPKCVNAQYDGENKEKTNQGVCDHTLAQLSKICRSYFIHSNNNCVLTRRKKNVAKIKHNCSMYVNRACHLFTVMTVCMYVCKYDLREGRSCNTIPICS